MIYQKKTINNVPTKRPISNSVPVGNPVGTIISTYKKIQPRNYLYCDGSTFDETIYPALYLYLGSNVLPDYRECAMVGAEKNTTDIFDSTETNPSTGLPGTQNHDVYGQGEFKDDQLQKHTHSQQIIGAGDVVYSSGSPKWQNETRQTSYNTGRSGSVTRGKRKAVYYYIKAVDGVDISDEDTFLNTVKNYVDGKNSYSLDEVPTGGVWIDGKPIYRKAISIGALPNNTTKYVAHNIANLDTVITMVGSAKRQDGVRLPLPFTSSSIVTNGIQIVVDDTDILVNAGVDRSGFVAFIALEYTKTTD